MHINENIVNMANNIYKAKTIAVIDYVKDLVTGEIIKKIKYKPLQSTINKATIQIFDAKNGELIKESISHNVVNNAIKQTAFLDYYYQKPFGKGSISYTNRFFDAIYLTNYTGNEDANELFIQGDILGWAGQQSTYSGADTRKGNYNSVESSIKDYNKIGYAKYVYDWPTHAGNGIINSIYWGYHENVNSIGYKCYIPIFWSENMQDILMGSDWSSKGDKFVFVNNNQNIYTYNMDFTTGNINYDLTSQLSTPIGLRGIDYDLIEGKWWIVNNADKKVYKGSYDPMQFNHVFTASDIASGETIEGLAFINGKVFIQTRSAVYRYSTTGTLQRKFTQSEYGFGSDTNSGKGIWNFKGNSSWVIISGYDGTDYWYGRCDQDGNLLAKQKCTDSRTNFTDYMNYFFFVRNEQYENSRVYIFHCDYWYWGLLNGFGAHTKLASPVTKDNTQTMKITYEFNVDLTQIT